MTEDTLKDLLAGGWLPLVLCPTDGVDRALLLPSGEEVVGAFHNPGGWRVRRTVEYDQTVYEERRGGFLPMELRPHREPERKAVGTRKAVMHLYGVLPEGVYPTHFRPNDTSWGPPKALIAQPNPSPATAEGGERD